MITLITNEIIGRFKGSVEGEIRRDSNRYWVVVRGDHPCIFTLPIKLRNGESGLTLLEDEIELRTKETTTK